MSDLRGDALVRCRVTLSGEGTEVEGRGANALCGPLRALDFLVRTLAASPHAGPPVAGEAVTTGTLTPFPYGPRIACRTIDDQTLMDLGIKL